MGIGNATIRLSSPSINVAAQIDAAERECAALVHRLGVSACARDMGIAPSGTAPARPEDRAEIALGTAKCTLAKSHRRHRRRGPRAHGRRRGACWPRAPVPDADRPADVIEQAEATLKVASNVIANGYLRLDREERGPGGRKAPGGARFAYRKGFSFRQLHGRDLRPSPPPRARLAACLMPSSL